MKLIQAAAAVMNQTPLDWRHNTANVRRAIQAAGESAAPSTAAVASTTGITRS